MKNLSNKWTRAAIPALLLHCSIGTVYCWSYIEGAIKTSFQSAQMGVSALGWAFSLAIFFLGMSAAFLGDFVEKDIHKASLIATICFAVGVVDKCKILNPKSMQEGDVIIALPSSGVHSNGFSLVRKVFGIGTNDISKPMEELGGKSVGETLLTPTKIYVKPILALLEEVTVRSISHITGGGFYENIPRSLPDGFGAEIDKASLKILPIFDLIQKVGDIPERDMFNTFNMGVGMSVVVKKEDAEKAVEILKANGEDAYIMGKIVKGEGVILK